MTTEAPMNAISVFTRRDLFDELSLAQINWSGRESEADFLERVFAISKLASGDYRVSTMYQEVNLHRSSFNDWGGADWVYTSDRLDLAGCPDSKLLEFLAYMVHPRVRPDQQEAVEIANTINEFLRRDGFQLEVVRVVSGKSIFAGVPVSVGDLVSTEDAMRVADVLASTHIVDQVTRMKAALATDPALAIGSAKEFVESIAKGILKARGIAHSNSETLPNMVKLVRDELGLSMSPGIDDTLKRTLSGLSTITQGIAELRGQLGTGHGSQPDTARPPAEVARLVVGMATTLGVFIYDMHRASLSASG